MRFGPAWPSSPPLDPSDRPAIASNLPLAPCLAGLLALCAWCMPNHQRPWTSFHSELAMAMAFLLAAAWSLVHYRHTAARAPALAFWLVGAGLIPLGQWLTGTVLFAGDAWLATLYLLGFALAVALGHRIASAEGPERLFDFAAVVLLTGSVLSVALSVYQWQDLGFLGAFAQAMPAPARAGANLAQPNHLATLLVLALSGTAWLHVRGRLNATAAMGLTAVLGFGLAMTQSRIGLLSVTALFGWLLLHRKRLGARLAPLRLLSAYAVVLGCVLLWGAIGGLQDGAGMRAFADTNAVGMRLTHWVSMLDAIGRRPLAGFGWNQVSLAQATVAADHPSFELIEHSHNLVLDLLVWNGIPLGVLLLALLLAWTWQALRGTRDAAGVVALGAVGIVFLHGMVEFASEYSYFLLPAGLLMGGVSAGAPTVRAWRVPNVVLAALTCVAAALTACVAKDYLALEEESRAIRFEQARVGLHVARAEPPRVLVLTQLEALLAVARERPQAGMSDAALERMRRVASRYPSGFALLHYAEALALDGEAVQAHAVLRPLCLTHSHALCASARAYWHSRGAGEPRIAAVPWPDE